MRSIHSHRFGVSLPKYQAKLRGKGLSARLVSWSAFGLDISQIGKLEGKWTIHILKYVSVWS